MRLFGSLTELVAAVFRKNSQAITLRPSQTVTYTAARDVQLPPQDANSVLVSQNATQTLTNKSIDADTNTITNIENADIKAAAAIDATKIANGSVSNTEFQFLDGVTSSIQTQINTKVTGPASATDNALTRFDGTTGKLVQDSAGILSDAGGLSGLTQLDVDNLRLDANTVSSTNTNGNIVLDPNGTGIIDAQASVQVTGGSLRSDTSLILEETGAGTDTITIQAPSSIAASYTLTLPVDDGASGEVLSTDGSGVLSWAASSAGQSLDINYIGNPSATTNTNGWTTYADAAGTSPVDGTGGSPTVTFTRNTTTPLRGAADFKFSKDAANRQGEGVSYQFTVDGADANAERYLFVECDYVVTGTYTSGDMKVFMTEVATPLAQALTPDNIIANLGIAGKFRGRLRPSSTDTQYRLIFHVSTTSASAYNLFLDNVMVRPDYVEVPIPDEILALSASTTLDPVSTNAHRYARKILVTTAGTNRTITLPPAAQNKGRVYSFKKVDSGTGTLIIDGNSAETIDGDATQTIYKQYGECEIACDGSAWYLTSGIIESGTYTPTLTNTTNISASTAFLSMFTRNGKMVSVAGNVDIDPSAGNTTTILGLSVPIPSNFTNNQTDLAGSGVAFIDGTVTPLVASIIADTGNDRAEFDFPSLNTANRTWQFNFTYIIK